MPRCGYLNDKFINKDDKKYIKTIYNNKASLFIFIGFEFSEINDLYNGCRFLSVLL